MLLAVGISLRPLALFPFASLNQFLSHGKKLIGLLHALRVDLRRGLFHIFQKSHALPQLFLHSVPLLLEALRLVLELLEAVLHVSLLLVVSCLTLSDKNRRKILT